MLIFGTGLKIVYTHVCLLFDKGSLKCTTPLVERSPLIFNRAVMTIYHHQSFAYSGGGSDVVTLCCEVAGKVGRVVLHSLKTHHTKQHYLYLPKILGSANPSSLQVFFSMSK